MSENKTRPTDRDVTEFLNSVEHETHRSGREGVGVGCASGVDEMLQKS